MSDMRVAGMASGMDIEGIVKDMMKAERLPLNKLEQEQTWLTWQRDSYRDVNKQLEELNTLAFDMRLQRTFHPKTATSSSSAVSVEATPTAGNGIYSINVTQIAKASYSVSSGEITSDNTFDPDASLASQQGKFSTAIAEGDFTITTYGEDGVANPVTFTVDFDKSLNDILSEINNSDLGVRAFYDKNADQVMIERTTTGDFRAGAPDIEFSGSNAAFLTSGLGLSSVTEGQNATFTYNNGLSIETAKNEYEINGLKLSFNDVTTGNVSINVKNNVDQALETITKFVDKYNQIIEDLNDRVTEKRYRDFPPLTDEQRESMEEKQIELWEEKAKSGMLRSDSTITSALFEMRSAWYQTVETDGAYDHLSDIGIETSADYTMRGKLLIDEADLRAALQEDPESVYELFASDEPGNEGIIRKLESTIENTINAIERKAGKPEVTDETYTLGRRIEDYDDQIADFEQRLIQIEDRYWRQFGAMERAIQQMNSQSAYLMQNFFS